MTSLRSNVRRNLRESSPRKVGLQVVGGLLLSMLWAASPLVAEEDTDTAPSSPAGQQQPMELSGLAQTELDPGLQAPGGDKAAPQGNCGGMAAGNCQGLPTDIYGAWIRFDNGQASFHARPVLLDGMRQLGCTVNLLKTEASKAEATDRWIKMLLYAETFGVKVRIVYGPGSSQPQTCFIRHVYLFHS